MFECINFAVTYISLKTMLERDIEREKKRRERNRKEEREREMEKENLNNCPWFHGCRDWRMEKNLCFPHYYKIKVIMFFFLLGNTNLYS